MGRFPQTRGSSPTRMRFLSIEPLLEDLGEINLREISWVIVGGESGAGARPLLESWVLRIKRRCARSAVPFFFKQWGGVHKSRAGRLLRGRTYDQYPSRPPSHALPLSECDRLAADIKARWNHSLAASLVTIVDSSRHPDARHTNEYYATD